MFTELNISPVKRTCVHKRAGLPDGRLCGNYHEWASLVSNEHCRRIAIHLTWFRPPLPSSPGSGVRYPGLGTDYEQLPGETRRYPSHRDRCHSSRVCEFLAQENRGDDETRTCDLCRDTAP